MYLVILCEHMHWTYDEYWNQPQWFLDALRIKLEEDGKYQAHLDEEAKRKS